MRLVLVACVLLCGCPGDAKPALDAGDGTFGAACTMDSVNSTECASHICTSTFDQIGHPVCSQLCTYGMNDSCPAGASGTKTCSMKGFCRP
jgi:hypothetical protein